MRREGGERGRESKRREGKEERGGEERGREKEEGDGGGLHRTPLAGGSLLASVKCLPTTSDEFCCVHRLRPVHLTCCQLPFFLKWLMFSRSSVSCATLLYGNAAFLVHRRQPSPRQS